MEEGQGWWGALGGETSFWNNTWYLFFSALRQHLDLEREIFYPPGIRVACLSQFKVHRCEAFWEHIHRVWQKKEEACPQGSVSNVCWALDWDKKYLQTRQTESRQKMRSMSSWVNVPLPWDFSARAEFHFPRATEKGPGRDIKREQKGDQYSPWKQFPKVGMLIAGWVWTDVREYNQSWSKGCDLSVPLPVDLELPEVPFPRC